MEGLKVKKAELLTLGEMRYNLRIDADDVDEARDENLMACAAAGEELVLNYCNTSWSELVDDYGLCIPASIHRAMLAIACGIYETPTGVSGRQQYVAPMHVMALLTPYVKLTKRCSCHD